MRRMHALRTSSTLIRLILVWFALTLGAAMASPLVAPKAFEMICTSGGSIQLIELDANGNATEAGPHTLDCAMCLPASLPIPQSTSSLPQPQPLAHALTILEVARIATLTGAPLPPRGPPAHA